VIESYLAGLDETRREAVARPDALIRESLPGTQPEIGPHGVGYGPFHYRYASGREGDAHRISLAARKHGVSLYVLALTEDERYLPEAYADRLGRVSVGKSCIRFKRIGDVDEDALRELLAEAAARPPAGAVS
jgi:hypothetical protein